MPASRAGASPCMSAGRGRVPRRRDPAGVTAPAGCRDPARRAHGRLGLARRRVSSAPRSPAARSRLRALSSLATPERRSRGDEARAATRKRRSRSPGRPRHVGAPRRLLAAISAPRSRASAGPGARCGGALRRDRAAGAGRPGLARRRLPQPPRETAEAAPRRRAPRRDGEHAPATPPGSSGRCPPFAVAPRGQRARRRHGHLVAARTRAGGRGTGATPRGAAAEGEPGAAGGLRP